MNLRATTSNSGSAEESAPLNAGTKPRVTRRTLQWALIAVFAAASLLYLSVLDSRRFGTYHDDGIYVATAKSMAEGGGYRIISLPYQPAQTKYPPFFPLLLSLVWRAFPDFPQNLPWMMLLSVIATLGFVLITARYLLGARYATSWQASVILAMTALNWRTMILATSIYSEMLFAMLSVAALHLAERHENARRSWASGLILGVLIGLSFLTRTSGVALLIAVVIYYASSKQWKKAALPIGIGSLFVLGWIGWSYANRTTFEGGNAAYYTSYVRDIGAMISNLAEQNHSSKLLAVLSIAGDNLLGGIVVSVPVVCLGISYDSISALGGYALTLSIGGMLLALVCIVAGFVRHVRQGGFRLLHIYLITYLGLHLFWPYASYDRFLLCVLPFLLLFLIAELDLPISLVLREATRGRKPAAKIIAGSISALLLLACAFTVVSYASGIRRTMTSLEEVALNAAEDSYLINWINENTRPDDVLICYRDPKYYLYTNRKAITFSWPKRGSSWEGQESLLFRIVSESGGRYLILTSTDFNHDYDQELQRESFKALLRKFPQMFAEVFKSPDGGGSIYRITNPSSPIGADQF